MNKNPCEEECSLESTTTSSPTESPSTLKINNIRLKSDSNAQLNNSNRTHLSHQTLSQNIHHHNHHDDHGHSHGFPENEKLLWVAALITFAFMVLEFVGGKISGSLALEGDAFHMAIDLLGVGLSIAALWLRKKPATPKKSFGFVRAEILGALLSGLLIWAICGYLLGESIDRFTSHSPVKGGMVVWIAVFGLLANLINMKLTHAHKDGQINMRAAYLHFLTDAMGSVGAILSGILIAYTEQYWIDPLITLAIAVLMLWSSSRLVFESVGVLMHFAPQHLDPEKIASALKSLPFVEGVHHLHLWSISSEQAALSVHLISKKPSESLTQAHQLLKEQFSISHSTIQIEESNS